MKKVLPVAALMILATLFFVWPIAHTLALRNALLLLSLLAFGWVVLRSKAHILSHELKTPYAIYGLLTIWLIVVAIVVSDQTAWSLWEIKGQWLKGSLALVLGTLAALSSTSGKFLAPRTIFATLTVALLAHKAYLVSEALVAWSHHGEIPAKISGLAEHYAYASHLTNILIVFLGAEALYRIILKRAVLPFGTWFLGFSIVLALASSYLEAARNAMIVLAALFVLASAWYWRERRSMAETKIVAASVGIALAFGGIFLYKHIQSDARWQTLFQTIPIALDTETNKSWIDLNHHPLPQMADGRQVDHSNYMRIAWFKEGLKLVAEHPLGIGFGRNAFDHAIKAKYGMATGGGSSHSGLLDFTIGTGIPGAVLWCAFLLGLMRLAARRWETSQSFYALALFFLVLSYGLRMLVDGIIRDHILEQFLFLAGLFSVWATQPSPSNRITEGHN